MILYISKFFKFGYLSVYDYERLTSSPAKILSKQMKLDLQIKKIISFLVISKIMKLFTASSLFYFRRFSLIFKGLEELNGL